MSNFLEEPNSPEYTIVSAIDDSCVLFAVKPLERGPEGDNSNESNSLNSTQKLVTPLANRN